ncbi:DUF7453 family protein [Iningainema tapete]|uniref:Uncharacterized protein n=1 Tax=Iningainema tapete BLCC-T55 TaxID=2748662 RepID=A0A8J7BZ46_9CYAN|nr:choice-of-anchor tandem repeat NxxGxxAF-containing protein [Iningainema tapete]MBD2776867.1 hypothetical protein [Iningainema tapete BLCC-T55]
MKTLSNNSVKNDQIHNHTTVSCPPNYASKRTKKSLRWMSRLSQGLAIAMSLSLLAASKAFAGNFSFTKIADSNDFSQIFPNVAINDSGTVVFYATPNTGSQGIYTNSNGIITELLNTNQLLVSIIRPNNYTYAFDTDRVDINNNDTVAFRLVGSQWDLVIATISNSTVKTVATGFAGRDSNIVTNFDLNDLEEVAYLRLSTPFLSPFESQRLLINRANQTFTLASACRGNSLCGGSVIPFVTLLNIGTFKINNQGQVTFSASSVGSSSSVFTVSNSSPVTLIEPNASLLDVNDNGDILFLKGTNFIRLLKSASDEVSTIVDTSGSFSQLGNAAINNQGNIAFTATVSNTGEKGIFTGADPVADKVIATGDTLFGSTVISLNFLPQGLNNNGQIAFYALLGNGTRGIYRAEPVPGVEIPQQKPLPSVENAFSLSKIVDTNTPIIKALGNELSLNLLNFDGDNVFFGVIGFINFGALSGEQQGIYKVSNGEFKTIVNQNTTVNQDKNTLIPGVTGNFFRLNDFAVNGNNVVFRNTNGQGNIYISREGVLEVIADANTPIPGGTGNFSFFGSVVLNENNLVFIGSGASGQRGIYLLRDGTLQVIADTNTLIPGGVGNFSSFSSVGLNKNNLVFTASGASGQQGIYKISGDGVVQLIADTNTSIPNGTGNFISFSNFVVDENNVVFTARGTNQQQGIYKISGDGVLQVIADKNTAIPGGTGNFINFSNLFLTTNGRNVIFITTSSTNQPNGIYISRDGLLQVLVDKNTNIPGTNSKFSGIGNTVIDGDNVAFLGDFGIYALIGDRLLKVADLDSKIDGKRISALSDLRLSGNSVVFSAILSDGTRTILRADLITNK